VTSNEDFTKPTICFSYHDKHQTSRFAKTTIRVSNHEERQMSRLTNEFTSVNLDLPAQSCIAEELRRKLHRLKGFAVPNEERKIR
jgi:hypothetical protein